MESAATTTAASSDNKNDDEAATAKNLNHFLLSNNNNKSTRPLLPTNLMNINSSSSSNNLINLNDSRLADLAAKNLNLNDSAAATTLTSTSSATSSRLRMMLPTNNENSNQQQPPAATSSISELNNSKKSSLFQQQQQQQQQKQTPELKLEILKPKPQSFFFNRNDLFAKPNELLEEDKQLTSMIKNELDFSQLNHHPHQQHHNQSSSSLNNRNHFHHRRTAERSSQRGGKLVIAPDKIYDFKESDLKDLGQIGHGEFGTVHKVLHEPSQTYMAMKRIGPTVGNQGERKKVLKELDFVQECHDYDYVVKFYGVKFNNEPADCLICMELMDTSLEKFYKFVYEVKKEEIPEEILGKIVVATVSALNYLKEHHQIIHRDVKPSNILVNRSGCIKMCDFGISGKLVDSIAASRDAGCQLYMAPERIDPERSCAHGYDVRSDIWSLGITLYELSTGRFPYPQWKTIFHQLNLVVESEAPRLESQRLSAEFRNFVNTCLTKNENDRPKYKALLEHPLFVKHKSSELNVSEYFSPIIEEMQTSQVKKR